MQYQPSREQRDLAETLDQPLAAILPLSRLHAAPWESGQAWTELEALGLFGLAVSEDDGGSGLGAVEEALVSTALGRRLASPSVFARLASVHARPLEAALAAAPPTVAFPGADGWVRIDDPEARSVLVRAADGAAIHPLAEGASVTNEGGPWLDRIAPFEPSSAPLATFDEAGLIRLKLIDAASMAGLADGATRAAVAYAGIREQFGRPIGSFQAVKHHCANMAVKARQALDLTTFAAVAVDDGRADAAVLAESALLTAGAAALFCAGLNIQIHGGIGFSDEADPHLFLKRAQLLLAISGGQEAGLERLAALSTSDAA